MLGLHPSVASHINYVLQLLYYDQILWGEGVIQQIFGKGDSIGSKLFVKMRGQKDLKPMKKEVNWIQNPGEN